MPRSRMHGASMSANRVNNSKGTKTRGATRSVNKSRGNTLVSKMLGALTTGVKALLGISIVAAGIYGGVLLTPYMNPKVTNIEVSGNLARLDRDRMTEVVNANITDGILTLDIKRLQEQISTIPWVETVRVVKQFPSTVLVIVDEEIAIAQWNELGYISTKGQFIQSVLYSDLASLPHLGSDKKISVPSQDAPAAIELFHRLNSVVLASGFSISQLQQSSVGGWQMTWNNGLSIDLGRADHLNRTRHAMAAWQRLPEEIKQNIERIDARYENGVAIRSRSLTQDRDSSSGELEPQSDLTDVLGNV